MTPVLSHLEYIYLMVSFEDLRLIRLAFVIQLCFYLFYVSLIITERELCAILFEFIAMLASSFNVREQFPWFIRFWSLGFWLFLFFKIILFFKNNFIQSLLPYSPSFCSCKVDSWFLYVPTYFDISSVVISR